MFTITINGNTVAELYSNMEALLKTRPNAPVGQNPVNPTVATVPSALPSPAGAPVATTPTAPTVPTMDQAAIQQPIANPIPAASVVPTSAPTYTLEQLAHAGAALAQNGKMEQALALLAKYGIQMVNQLKPEQYGAFATELRALGARI